MKYILFWLLSLSFPQPPIVQPIEVSIHAGFDSLLQKHVSDLGIVNYDDRARNVHIQTDAVFAIQQIQAIQKLRKSIH